MKCFWLIWLLQELAATQSCVPPLMCDNEVACHIAVNTMNHERTKHVEMDSYFMRE